MEDKKKINTTLPLHFLQNLHWVSTIRQKKENCKRIQTTEHLLHFPFSFRFKPPLYGIR
ncbi:hypothetical protein RND71_004927 [Anisodus tanguticus]|uniref:Uncharacterized protein n=1 Tax=Anisodus tanguticus TaxID=243964 RepID=A0AAE1SQG9_9SOLA|nr:hypothetical protein RND71_004927 [Anisodus tanguticus]